MTVNAAAEAMRIVRRIEVAHGSSRRGGSGFVAGDSGRIVTCAHVVVDESGRSPSEAAVIDRDGNRHAARVLGVDRGSDLAALGCDDPAAPATLATSGLPAVGTQVVFAGQPDGVRRLSAFPGMVSATGDDLIDDPKGDMIQLAGMINNGNSGGPVVQVGSGEVIGIVTAKYVPLLAQIDSLLKVLENTPQVPAGTSVSGIDFGKFFNANIAAMHRLAAVLRLVQVGTGWAIPARRISTSGLA